MILKDNKMRMIKNSDTVIPVPIVILLFEFRLLVVKFLDFDNDPLILLPTSFHPQSHLLRAFRLEIHSAKSFTRSLSSAQNVKFVLQVLV